MSLNDLIDQRQKLTPTSGANLCEIDDFSFPYDLVFLANYETMALAEEAMKSPQWAGRKLTIIPAPGLKEVGGPGSGALPNPDV